MIIDRSRAMVRIVLLTLWRNIGESLAYVIAGRPGGVSGYPRAWYRSVS